MESPLFPLTFCASCLYKQVLGNRDTGYFPAYGSLHANLVQALDCSQVNISVSKPGPAMLLRSFY